MARAESGPSTEIAATKTTPVETTLAAASNKLIELPKIVIVLLGLSILIVPILIFALLWLLLSKRQHTDVMHEIRTGISIIDDRLIYGQKQQKHQQLETWQEFGEFLDNQMTKQQEQLQAITQQLTLAQNPFQVNLNRQEAQQQASTSVPPPTTPLQPKQELAPKETQQQLETLTENQQTLQNVLHGRFRLVKPESTDFSHWTTALIEQQGTWRWAQPALLAELLACETSLKQIKEQGDKKARNILTLLELDNLLKHWNTLVAHFFDSDTELWQHLYRLDNGKWLNRLLEMGVQLIKPQLLEKVPDDVPEKYYNYQPHPILKQLVKSQVLEKLKTVPKFVVDIDTYGFITADNPKPDVRVFVGSPAEWE
ncbi:MAG: hypothetical protein B6247_14790 [Candidatus Parabeggiatoa sp. nov. 2]|nr:MAG: hypothetical protein B6247_14790 [Beggiatoa sp. 4572_84]